MSAVCLRLGRRVFRRRRLLSVLVLIDQSRHGQTDVVQLWRDIHTDGQSFVEDLAGRVEAGGSQQSGSDQSCGIPSSLPPLQRHLLVQLCYLGPTRSQPRTCGG